MDVEALPFPKEGILPKAETEASKFIEEHPEWDGRGIKVAIFDTGVDPGAAGLLVTSDGRPKMIDVVDCTGSGDVDTSEVVELKEGETTITGLSGRTLNLGSRTCPSGKFHLGLKRAYELFPRPLVKRVKEERKESFLVKQQEAVAAAQAALREWEKSHKSPNDKEKKERKDLEQVVDALKEAMEQYSDPGPAFDCVVYSDGERWRALIDFQESGDLQEVKALATFREEREFVTLSSVRGVRDHSVLLNVCVGIFQEGDLLSIVCEAGSHGTHVAGIVAANFPDDPKLNGIAPGAQIVSCKIGDSRLGSMETGTSLIRALKVAKDNGCQLINLSYGESFVHDKSGRVPELINEFVNKHGIIFVCSAGNNGPALSTVGAPACMSSSFISVGAFVSPGMMEVEYSLRETLASTNYTWSSRGPSPDGNLGVTICAPGGAIAPVPTWTLQGKQLMNGTSMSSPNCCGGLALILSALLSGAASWTPASIRRVIQNSALKVEGIEPWALGPGLLQVDKAFQHFKAHQNRSVAFDVPIDVVVPARDDARGLYLRDLSEVSEVFAANLFASPKFHDECDNRQKVAFEVKVSVKSTASWCEVPNFLMLNASGKGFEARVDPSSLPTGAHFCEILGFDSECPSLGPIFRFPVTVIKPMTIPPGDFSLSLPAQRYLPGTLDRHFLSVPRGATWAEFTVKPKQLEGNHMLVLHCLQVLPSSPVTSRNPSELDKYLRLKPFTNVTERVSVRGGVTLEVCMCKWWASIGEVEVDIEIVFHGVEVSSEVLAIGSAEPVSLFLSAPLRSETISLSSKLTHLRKLLRPTKSSINVRSPERDLLPNNRQIYEMELSYSFEQTEKEAVKVTPRASMFEVLYDSPLDSQLWMIFDSNSQLMGSGDGLHTYDVSLPKGKYSLRLQLRHDSKSLLDSLKSLVLCLDFALAKELSCRAFASYGAAITNGEKLSKKTLTRGERVRVFFTGPSDKVAGGKPGDVLLGSIACGEVKNACRVQVLLPPEESKEEQDKDESSKKKTPEERQAEQMLEAKIKVLKSLREDKMPSEFEALAKELRAENPKNVQVLKEILSKRDVEGDSAEAEQQRKSRCLEAIEATNWVLDSVDQKELAAHYGLKQVKDDPESKEKCKEMDKLKEILIDALLCRLERFQELLLPAPSAELMPDVDLALAGCQDKSPADFLKENLENLNQWTASDQKFEQLVRYTSITSAVKRRQGRAGGALEDLLKVMKSNEGPPSKKIVSELEAIAEQMGWTHWKFYYVNLKQKFFPKKTLPF
ncbi:tripeptidyl peptidase II [Guillardia theta CCMP2712]|uniref:Tripeptidyl-peptidase 2 n=1 Tax=Guillardia theta (strain CCMP2712) TaxID=905079 RepID=L1K1G7_GUITC|nr:tripeptidyl peptidase II [Guillardia theta CCMP2712]EKX54447.1 tripeptidyl peptidase II [Guillardia theta CCMP2712]|eukprot:XP_005841427.1 tripeptidyl peptidase II [Guillardia theta CCMP2712]